VSASPCLEELGAVGVGAGASRGGHGNSGGGRRLGQPQHGLGGGRLQEQTRERQVEKGQRRDKVEERFKIKT
jgi:hypothetical protein